MDDAARAQLRHIIVTYGIEVSRDPQRVEGFLRDLAGQHRREISVLVGAAREGVPEALLAGVTGPVSAMLTAQLVQRLEDNLGLTTDAARWAIGAWASALDVVQAAAAPRQAPGPAVAVTPAAPTAPTVAAAVPRGGQAPQSRPVRSADRRAAAALRLIAEDDEGNYQLSDRLDAARRLARLDPGAATDVYYKIATNHYLDLSERLEVAKELAKLDPRRVAHVFYDIASAEDNEIFERLDAAERLAGLDPGRAADVLYGIAADDYVDVPARMSAAELLMAFDRNRAADAFYEIASGDSGDVYIDDRLAAAERLVGLDPSRAADVFYTIATDNYNEVSTRLDAAERLARLDTSRAVDVDDFD